jgi:ParB/RepB/Spo0J family partition protein
MSPPGRPRSGGSCKPVRTEVALFPPPESYTYAVDAAIGRLIIAGRNDVGGGVPRHRHLPVALHQSPTPEAALPADHIRWCYGWRGFQVCGSRHASDPTRRLEEVKTMEWIPIADIEIGERRREDLGDIAALAASIERYGLLHPPVVERGRKALVAGWRRIKACQLLGWTHIEVRWYDDLTDAERQPIELEENVRRKDLTPAERAKTLVHQADTMAERLTREAQAAADNSSNDHQNPPAAVRRNPLPRPKWRLRSGCRSRP